jgi:hypothetical protein
MIRFKEFQFAWLIVALYLIVSVVLTLAFFSKWGKNPLDVYNYIFFMALLAGVVLAFFGLTIIVTDKHLIIKFGIGLYSKKIGLKTIISAAIVNTPVYRGYGIMFIRNGLLYNLGRKRAVEIGFRKGKQIIVIGTRAPEKLMESIETGIAT